MKIIAIAVILVATLLLCSGCAYVSLQRKAGPGFTAMSIGTNAALATASASVTDAGGSIHAKGLETDQSTTANALIAVLGAMAQQLAAAQTAAAQAQAELQVSNARITALIQQQQAQSSPSQPVGRAIIEGIPARAGSSGGAVVPSGTIDLGVTGQGSAPVFPGWPASTPGK